MDNPERSLVDKVSPLAATAIDRGDWMGALDILIADRAPIPDELVERANEGIIADDFPGVEVHLERYQNRVRAVAVLRGPAGFPF